MGRVTLGLICLGAICPWVLGVGEPAAWGQSLGRTSFADRATGLRLFLPAKWVTQARSSLPGLVASFKHPLGARLLISTQTRRNSDTPRTLAAAQATLLRRHAWTVQEPTPNPLGPADGVLVEATDPSRKKKVFQVYALHDKHMLVLTLSVPSGQSPKLLADLRFVTRTARFAR